jgi:3-oxoacyl-[acyl-carrier protein] reductase
MKAVITGSSKGLGYEIARSFVKQGIDVAVTARQKTDLTKIISELKNINDECKITGTTVDFEDEKSIAKYCEKVKLELGDIDVLVNNVGLYLEDTIGQNIDNSLKKILEVNVFSAVRMSNAFIESMKKKSSAHIINIISVAALHPRIDAVSYSISKAALKSYNDAQRESLKASGIKVVGIYPGAMNTSSWDGQEADTSQMIQPEDVSKSILQIIQMSDNTTVEELIINTNKPLV